MTSHASSPSLSMRMTVYGIKKAFPSVRNVTCEQLHQWRRDESKKLICFDTRPREEYDVSHISGAIRVDPDQDHSMESLGITSDNTVVCYCSVGYRSSNVAKVLYSKHSKDTPPETSSSRPGTITVKLDIYNLEGGLFQWANEGREVVNNSGDRVATVHPYSAFWGKLLNRDLQYQL